MVSDPSVQQLQQHKDLIKSMHHTEVRDGVKSAQSDFTFYSEDNKERK